ncbi:MAG: histidine triad nucleotide-binding protein [Vampirovibrionales bacterium]|nr:histidine triad nucleotide-binding protein [Vampirovibrionales bacterium]
MTSHDPSSANAIHTQSPADCLFCKLIAGQIPANIVFQNDHVLAFTDIAPKAPTHLLFIPRQHVESLAHVQDDALYAQVFSAIRDFASANGIAHYRVICNTGAGAGQTVFHWHAHLLAGRAFEWPPG